ncbi:citrate (Si)-synthase [Chloroflexota bacterium]|nr:citrate (Si)-synthase [Chloroflexota bacterium]
MNSRKNKVSSAYPDLKSRSKLTIEDRIAAQLPGWHDRLTRLLRQYGDKPIGEITVASVYGGMRGLFALVTEISHVDPSLGLLIRGYSVDELLQKLPKVEGSDFPLLGGLYHLLLVGEFPTHDDAMTVEDLWRQEQGLPGYVVDMLKAMPASTHPMTLFSQAIIAMQPESVAAKAYHEGIDRNEYWRPMLADALKITANLPTLAATIYNLKYRDGAEAIPDPDLDWSANFAHMIGKGDDPDYKDLCRLFMTLHSDQESGNASAHTSHLVSSTLSDLYLSSSAGLNALAGPLHGLASQETLRWLQALREQYGGLPSQEELKDFALETLEQGMVIPGYGHGVLRRTDTRFTAQYRFAEVYMPEDPLFQLVKRVYEVLPEVLGELGKVNNPWPNVDAISGTLQHHYGIEPEFCTVLFGASRLLGLTAHAVWARALGQPIERPRSFTTDRIEEIITPLMSVNSPEINTFASEV